MCGIAGFVATDVDRIADEVGPAMRAAILYRGRDGQGEWGDGRQVKLFHSRLSVIDLETGDQPMTDVTGRYVIVFNGEIYNYPELRAEYEARGARFRTRSDTEAILAGYALKGSGVCADLNGMFAFALWDREEQRLFLARDHLGKKPLYWCVLEGAFYFASTLQAFDRIPGWSGRLSSGALTQYAVLGSFPEESTVYEQARALPWASSTFVRPGRAPEEPERYWRMDFSRKTRGSENDLLAEYEEILADAVRIRLRSDVPLALTFSGGVDSGTIAALAARKLGAALACYTIDYHTKDDPSEESIQAEGVARQLGLAWHYIHFDYERDLLPGLREAYREYDQPCQQLPLVYSRRLYQAIKPYATVVLSGNGADELFTGYDGDERIRREDLVLAAIAPLRPMLRRIPSLPAYLRAPVPQAYSESLRRRMSAVSVDAACSEELGAAAERLASEVEAAGARNRLDLWMFQALICSAVDSNYRLPDVSGLAAQVEVRSPFLDHRMVQFAARLPHRFKIGRLFSPAANKYLPKRYYERFVPREVAWGPKRGMAWNLRWDRSIVGDPGFARAFACAFDAIERRGLGAGGFRRAWELYLADRRNGGEGSAHASVMMNGFMLGSWLLLEEERA